MTAAIQSAFAIESDAKAAAAGDFESWGGWESQFRRSAASLPSSSRTSTSRLCATASTRATGGAAFDAAAAGHAAAGDAQPATAVKAQVRCEVA